MTTQETIKLNKEITKIIALFRDDKNSGYTLLSAKQETKLIVRIQEIERKPVSYTHLTLPTIRSV